MFGLLKKSIGKVIRKTDDDRPTKLDDQRMAS